MKLGSTSGRRTPNRMFAVRLHATRCSLRETTAILAKLGIKRSHEVVLNGVHRLADNVTDPPRAKPSRVEVDETAVKINGGRSWLYTAIVIDPKLILEA